VRLAATAAATEGVAVAATVGVELAAAMAVPSG